MLKHKHELGVSSPSLAAGSRTRTSTFHFVIIVFSVSFDCVQAYANDFRSQLTMSPRHALGRSRNEIMSIGIASLCNSKLCTMPRNPAD